MNSFFVPQLGSQIYTMAGMVDAPPPAGRPSRAPTAGCRAQFSGERLCRHALYRRRGVGRRASRAGWTRAARAGPVLDAQTYAELAKPSEAVAPVHLSRGRRPISSTASIQRAAKCTMRLTIRRHRGRKSESPRQARLERDPVRPADHHGGVGADDPRHRRHPRLDHAQGILALSVARVAHQRRPQAHRRDVHRCWRW